MNVVKRDGRTVDYDRNKIFSAITKANATVNREDRVEESRINQIILAIEGLWMWRLP